MHWLKLISLWVLLSTGCVKPFVLAEGVTINPYGKTPLSGVFRLTQKNSAPLKIRLKGKKKSRSVEYTYPEQYGYEFPIHGLYSRYTNNIILSLGEKVILETNVYIEDVYTEQKKRYPKINNPSIIVHKNNNKFDPLNQDFYFLYDNYTNIAAYDGDGELRYLYKTPDRTLARIELQKNELYFYFVDRAIKRVTLLGQQKLEANIPIHHDFVYKNIKNKTHKIALTISPRGGVEDRVTEVNSSGKIVRDLLIGDVFRAVIPKEKWYVLSNTVYDVYNIQTNRITKKEKATDWAHANSLVYDEDKDILYLSLRHLGVIAVNYKEWSLLWWLADPKLSTLVGQGYGEVPPNFVYLHEIKELGTYKLTAKTYPKNQHSLLLKTNGNLLMFDNNGDKVHNYQGSRVLEYDIDLNEKQAKLVRQYRHPRRVYSRLLSDVDLLADGDWLILWGFDTPTTDFRITRLAEVDTKNRLVVDMSLRRDWVYRVEKKPLYPYQDKSKQYSVDVLEKEKI